MKKKHTAHSNSKRTRQSFPGFFLVVITLILIGVVVVVIHQNRLKQRDFVHNSEILGVSSVASFFDFFKSFIGKNSSVSITPSKTKLPQTTPNREVGDAGEFYPYGKIMDSTVIDMPVSGNGGVIEATLSGKINFYLVYPSNLPEGATLTLTPYYSMPTAKESVPLSHELGYGLDIQWELSRHGELPSQMYAVFDLDEGKTIAQIRKDTKTKYFCDPTAASFNPQACAFINNVPLSSHSNMQYAVVSPIRSERLTHMASMEPTVQIGYENLLVVPLSKEATLIPQKLSTELLHDLIKANGISSATNIYRNQAITFAIENNIYTPENIDGILGEYHAIDLYENIKLFYQLPKLQTFYKKIKDGSNLNASEKILAEKLVGSNYSYDNKIKDNLKDLHNNVSIQFSDTNAPEHYITGAAMIRRLEKEGIDMIAEKSKFVQRLIDDFDYYLEDDPGYISQLLITAVMLSPKDLAQRTFGIWNLEVFAEEGQNMTPEEIQEIIDEYMRKGKREMNRLCGDDAYVPPSSIERGLKFANLIGDDEGADKCQRKMCADLDEILNSEKIGTPQEEGKNITLYSKWCDDSNEKQEKWIKRVLKSDKKLRCVTKIKKNLLDFADNRVFCSEVLDEDGGIDGYYDSKEVTKQTLRNKGETAPLDMDAGPGYSP